MAFDDITGGNVLGGSAESGKDAPVMNIAKAKRIFQDCGPDLVREYDSIVKFCRENKVSAPLANGNFMHALTLTELLFGHTDNSLRMLTGGHGDGFIACLKSTFVAMLNRLRRNNGKARIVVVNGDRESALLNRLRADYPNTLDVKHGSATTPIAHFIVGDSEMVRDEKPHPELDDSSDANLIKADVYFHSPAIASLFEDRFDSIWDRLSS
jgi:hypothetical protein